MCNLFESGTSFLIEPFSLNKHAHRDDPSLVATRLHVNLRQHPPLALGIHPKGNCRAAGQRRQEQLPWCRARIAAANVLRLVAAPRVRPRLDGTVVARAQMQKNSFISKGSHAGNHTEAAEMAILWEKQVIAVSILLPAVA